MKELFVLISREYSQKVREKTFIVSTVIGLLVIIGLSFAPAIQDYIRSSDKMNILVMEETGQMAEYLNTQLSDELPNGEREFDFTAYKTDPGQWETVKEQQIEALLNGEHTAVLEILPNPGSSPKAIFHSKQIDMGSRTAKIQGALQQLSTQERIASSGLTPAQMASIFEPIAFEVQAEGLRAETAEQQSQNMMLVYFLLFILYFSLINYGMIVAQGVIEEKSSRIMETMISTVRPMTLMAAKIIGIGAVGLTQYIIMLGSGIALFVLKGKGLSIGGMEVELSTIDPVNLIYFFVFFVLGFLLYAAMYAGVGSMVSRVEDTNQAVGPMTFLIIAGFLLAMFALVNPDNPVIVALSYVPFFTPMILFARIVLTNISGLSIALGIADMIVSTAFLIWLAGRMYRIGVLLYGKVNLKDMYRLIVRNE